MKKMLITTVLLLVAYSMAEAFKFSFTLEVTNDAGDTVLQSTNVTFAPAPSARFRDAVTNCYSYTDGQTDIGRVKTLLVDHMKSLVLNCELARSNVAIQAEQENIFVPEFSDPE